MRLIDIAVSDVLEARLDELKPSHAKGLRDMGEKDADALHGFLQQHGFKELGNGLYSSVWGSQNSNAVVKVTHGVGDKCWLSFAETIGKHPNKHFPKISKVQVYTDQSTQKPNFYCFMERLTDIFDMPITDDDVELAAFLLGHFGIQVMPPPKIAELLGSNITPSVLKDVGQSYRDANSLLETIEFLQSNIPHACRWDLHDGNIMWRPSTNTLVITDPFS